jgi:hypothetical protein
VCEVNQFPNFRQRKAQSLHLLDEAKAFRVVIGVQPESTWAANWFGQKSAFLVKTDCIDRERSSLRKFADLHSGAPDFLLGCHHKNTLWSAVQSQ